KYDESLFGSILKKDEIADLECRINHLILQGNPDSSYTFIRKKIDFKTTKVKLLEQAKNEVLHSKDLSTNDQRRTLRFFSHVNEELFKSHPEAVLSAGLNRLHSEIERQEKKI